LNKSGRSGRLLKAYLRQFFAAYYSTTAAAQWASPDLRYNYNNYISRARTTGVIDVERVSLVISFRISGTDGSLPCVTNSCVFALLVIPISNSAESADRELADNRSAKWHSAA